mmetsp:Transcript_116073/g.315179  ORF Transcript_116073/g.315179 Transcript_116073/m.315179 type:complete len:211 (-) Transcript_116073:145-777(-)
MFLDALVGSVHHLLVTARPRLCRAAAAALLAATSSASVRVQEILDLFEGRRLTQTRPPFGILPDVVHRAQDLVVAMLTDDGRHAACGGRGRGARCGRGGRNRAWCGGRVGHEGERAPMPRGCGRSRRGGQVGHDREGAPLFNLALLRGTGLHVHYHGPALVDAAPPLPQHRAWKMVVAREQGAREHQQEGARQAGPQPRHFHIPRGLGAV